MWDKKEGLAEAPGGSPIPELGALSSHTHSPFSPGAQARLEAGWRLHPEPRQLLIWKLPWRAGMQIEAEVFLHQPEFQPPSHALRVKLLSLPRNSPHAINTVLMKERSGTKVISIRFERHE